MQFNGQNTPIQNHFPKRQKGFTNRIYCFLSRVPRTKSSWERKKLVGIYWDQIYITKRSQRRPTQRILSKLKFPWQPGFWLNFRSKRKKTRQNKLSNVHNSGNVFERERTHTNTPHVTHTHTQQRHLQKNGGGKTSMQKCIAASSSAGSEMKLFNLSARSTIFVFLALSHFLSSA